MTTHNITINQTSPQIVNTITPYTLLRQAWQFNRTLTVSTLFSLALLPIVLLAIWLDPVTIVGVNGWVKPLKFLVSTLIYAPSLMWLLMQVRGWRPLVSFSAWFVGVTWIVENSFIIMQVVRRTTSHYNVSTPFDTFVINTMGLLIMIVALLNLLVAIRLIFQKFDNRVFGWSLRLGLLITVVGMWLAFLMVDPTPTQLAQAQVTGTMPIVGAHSVSVADGGAGLPILGWSTTGGDLRVPHFVGLHALQALPLIGWLLTRPRSLRRWNEGQRVGLVWVAGLGYLSWMGLLTWQALRGESLVAPGLLTLSALSALLVATAGSALFVTRWPGRSSARA